MTTLSNPIHVLLADDDSDDYQFFKESLDNAGMSFKLTNVEDGAKLMKYLQKIKEPPPPDVIFLDINMPFKNGLECLEEIRRDKKFDNIPIIIFSTSDHPRDIEETFTKGANLYISKMIFFGSEQIVLQYLFSKDWREKLADVSKEKFFLKNPKKN